MVFVRDFELMILIDLIHVGKDLGSLQHRGDEALTLRVAGANSNLKHSMMK